MTFGIDRAVDKPQDGAIVVVVNRGDPQVRGHPIAAAQHLGSEMMWSRKDDRSSEPGPKLGRFFGELCACKFDLESLPPGGAASGEAGRERSCGAASDTSRTGRRNTLRWSLSLAGLCRQRLSRGTTGRLDGRFRCVVIRSGPEAQHVDRTHSY